MQSIAYGKPTLLSSLYMQRKHCFSKTKEGSYSNQSSPSRKVSVVCHLFSVHYFIFRAVSDNFTANHIERLPNTPRQNGTNSILSFYAVLPSGSNSLSKSVLATIFVTEQDDIFSLNSELEYPGISVPSSETPILTPAQTNNSVSVTILNFKRTKVRGSKGNLFRIYFNIHVNCIENCL